MLQLHDHLNCCLFSLVLPDHAAALWRIMQQLHDHAETSLVNSFVYKSWWGHALHEHEQPCDLQPGITVTDWLFPRPPYASQSANTQVWYTKIPGESIRILGVFSPLTLLGARMLRRAMRSYDWWDSIPVLLWHGTDVNFEETEAGFTILQHVIATHYDHLGSL